MGAKHLWMLLGSTEQCDLLQKGNSFVRATFHFQRQKPIIIAYNKYQSFCGSKISLVQRLSFLVPLT